MKLKSESEVAQSCPTLSDPMDCSPPGSSIYGIFQAKVLEWAAIAFSTLHLRAGLTCQHRWSRLHRIPCVCQCDVNRHEAETFSVHTVGFTSCTPVICCEMIMAGWLLGTRKRACLWNKPEPDLKPQNQAQPCLSLKQNGTGWPRHPYKRTNTYLYHRLPVTEFRAVCYTMLSWQLLPTFGIMTTKHVFWGCQTSLERQNCPLLRTHRWKKIQAKWSWTYILLQDLMYAWGWCMLMYDKKNHNIVK